MQLVCGKQMMLLVSNKMLSVSLSHGGDLLRIALLGGFALLQHSCSWSFLDLNAIPLRCGQKVKLERLQMNDDIRPPPTA